MSYHLPDGALKELIRMHEKYNTFEHIRDRTWQWKELQAFTELLELREAMRRVQDLTAPDPSYEDD